MNEFKVGVNFLVCVCDLIKASRETIKWHEKNCKGFKRKIPKRILDPLITATSAWKGRKIP